jgi:hypothetical protein
MLAHEKKTLTMDYRMKRFARMKILTWTGFVPGLVTLAWLSLAGCNRPNKSDGETLARQYCAACHAFPEPQLLDKKTWETGVLPQMAPRLGVVGTPSLFDQPARDPHMMVLPKGVSEEEWEKIVRYYRELAPDALPYQSLPAEPQVDPAFFKAVPFAPRLKSSAIITLLKTDPAHERIFVGEAGSNRLRIFDWNRRLISSLTLASPPTDLIVDGDHVLVLESGILDPNDQPKGTLVQYDFPGADSLRSPKVLIDSLFRPVFLQQFDFDKDGVNEFLICEFGNNTGRLALYKHVGSAYQRQVLDPTPGSIRFEIHDMTGDGSPDIVALFAQADERIVLFENDGKGNFSGRQRILARFPPVYGSMFFSMHDFNGDGSLDILYVNGDNFDYSRVLKPYHGVRILENDGKNNFKERFFFPVYGAARAEVADFDKDGDLDILATSNFADTERHPERGIMFLENTGGYRFRPYAFSVASRNQWNLMATADLNKDGWLDVIIGAMDLESIGKLQHQFSGQRSESRKDPLLFFENRMQAKSNPR